MSRKVYCTKCNTLLGIIRDAKLHKGIKYLCKACDTQRQSLELMHKNKDTSNPFGDIFKEWGI